MPNIVPAPFAYSAGSLAAKRLVPALFRFSGNRVLGSKVTPVTEAAATPELDRLRRFDALVKGNQVSPRFQIIWQQTMEAIEQAFEAVNARVDEVALYARLNAVEQLASSANDNANAAQKEVVKVKAATRQAFDAVDPSLGEEFERETQRQTGIPR